MLFRGILWFKRNFNVILEGFWGLKNVIFEKDFILVRVLLIFFIIFVI